MIYYFYFKICITHINLYLICAASSTVISDIIINCVLIFLWTNTSLQVVLDIKLWRGSCSVKNMKYEIAIYEQLDTDKDLSCTIRRNLWTIDLQSLLSSIETVVLSTSSSRRFKLFGSSKRSSVPCSWSDFLLSHCWMFWISLLSSGRISSVFNFAHVVLTVYFKQIV